MENNYVLKLSAGLFAYSQELENEITKFSINSYKPFIETNSDGIRVLVVNHVCLGVGTIGTIPIRIIYRYIKNK